MAGCCRVCSTDAVAVGITGSFARCCTLAGTGFAKWGAALCALSHGAGAAGGAAAGGAHCSRQARWLCFSLESAKRSPKAQCLRTVSLVAHVPHPVPQPCHHCPCAEHAAWELHASMLRDHARFREVHMCDHAGLHAVHIPPVVLNPDCSLGLAEPDQQLPKDAEAATGDWEQPRQQQQQQQVAQQQGQRQAPQQQLQHSQRTALGRPSGGVELQQLPPTVLHSAPQQPGVCGFCWLPLDCCQLPMRMSILPPAAGKRRSHLAARSACPTACCCLPASLPLQAARPGQELPCMCAVAGQHLRRPPFRPRWSNHYKRHRTNPPTKLPIVRHSSLAAAV